MSIGEKILRVQVPYQSNLQVYHVFQEFYVFSAFKVQPKKQDRNVEQRRARGACQEVFMLQMSQA